MGTDGKTFMTTEEVAALLRTSPSTLRHWRRSGYGPSYIKLGRHVLYVAESLDAWLMTLKAASA